MKTWLRWIALRPRARRVSGHGVRRVHARRPTRGTRSSTTAVRTRRRAPAGGRCGRPRTTCGPRRWRRHRRLVYVIVDGLREDVSRKMPTINALRAHGYDAVVRTSQPTLSFPNWTTLLSGAPQRISGVTTNWFEERVPVETLIDVALAGGPQGGGLGADRLRDALRREALAVRLPARLAEGHVHERRDRRQRDPPGAGVERDAGGRPPPGHRRGGPRVRRRVEGVPRHGDEGRRRPAAGSWSRCRASAIAFVVASDHGHIDTGGHGGLGGRRDEGARRSSPGAGVQAGAGEGTQDQVAPTVALLNGLARSAERHRRAVASLAADAPERHPRFDIQQTAASPRTRLR